jgi:hypothetical protein
MMKLIICILLVLIGALPCSFEKFVLSSFERKVPFWGQYISSNYEKAVFLP